VKRKSADITARMSRSEVAEAQAKARAAAFAWPAPPYYEFSDPAAAADGADCLLMFRDGAKASGVLLSFMPEGQVLRFRAADAADSISVAFSSLFGVQLRRPVEIRRPALRADDTAQLYSAAERQPFAMRLTNGTALRGETVGSVRALCGVFLFPPDRGGTVTRWFVPADATDSVTIGKPIGETLVQERVPRATAPAEVRKRIDVGIGEAESLEQDDTLVALVNKMIVDAVDQKASDIHIEANPGGKDMRVRFRKDGALVTYRELPAKLRTAVVSRLKIMAQLDITESRQPQDGKIEFRRFGPRDVDLRLATIPTSGGLEDMVLRVLGEVTPVALDALGFDAKQLQAVKRLISRPHGLFLVCGPTGAGKTTTLHSLLRELNTAALKIWTAEDPIEIVQAGLRQVQVNPKIGWTFAAAMRSFMRADPDVIMVGEMRDAETARTGIEASLTGHLVFSTLQTNSAVESVGRLLDLGMDPFNFADALLGVLAQRLVRKLCSDCKVAYAPNAAELEELASESRVLPPRQMLYRAKGCVRCDRTGYQGRVAVYELLVADPAVKRLMQMRAPVSGIAAAAAASGLRTLKQSALDKVIEGHTDLQQVRTITS
jgi:type II secretory ATPase GspE/PulE/Tfp pilus assembly ATPase PilB-like protein